MHGVMGLMHLVTFLALLSVHFSYVLVHPHITKITCMCPEDCVTPEQMRYWTPSEKMRGLVRIALNRDCISFAEG